MEKLIGTIQMPSDKSITHRALFISSLCQGTSEIIIKDPGLDIRSTINCLSSLGISITQKGNHFFVAGKGLHGYQCPVQSLECGNSGTTVRLLLGILSGQSIACTLTGDSSLSSRPMKRITTPLTKMGGIFHYCRQNDSLPIEISSTICPLHGISYKMPVPSAQLKSALLFASLYADGATVIEETSLSRNHTENMLSALGCPIEISDHNIKSKAINQLSPFTLEIPGDPSSAAFFIAGAILIPDSELYIEKTSLNPTRTAFLKILQKMGAKIDTQLDRTVLNEPVGSIHVCYSILTGVDLTDENVPSFIDEIPVIALLASFATGRTTIRHAQELRKKESDRIETICDNLSHFGVTITKYEDGFSIEGGFIPQNCIIKTGHDHRIAMTFALLNLIYPDMVTLDDPGCMDISFPGYLTALSSLITFH